MTSCTNYHASPIKFRADIIDLSLISHERSILCASSVYYGHFSVCKSTRAKHVKLEGRLCLCFFIWARKNKREFALQSVPNATVHSFAR